MIFWHLVLCLCISLSYSPYRNSVKSNFSTELLTMYITCLVRQIAPDFCFYPLNARLTSLSTSLFYSVTRVTPAGIWIPVNTRLDILYIRLLSGVRDLFFSLNSHVFWYLFLRIKFPTGDDGAYVKWRNRTRIVSDVNEVYRWNPSRMIL